MNNKIIIALDGLSKKRALKIASILRGKVWGFKVGDMLYEKDFDIKELKKYGHVFADIKLHDIPSTVANSVKRLSKAGAKFITVHASGGIEMMKAARRNAGKSKIIAVTILTSEESRNTKKNVLRFAKAALRVGVHGIVCSGHELSHLNRKKMLKHMIKIVPGVRPDWYTKKDDQKRKTTPSEAINLGADYLVIGRPITKAKNPLTALRNLY